MFEGGVRLRQSRDYLHKKLDIDKQYSVEWIAGENIGEPITQPVEPVVRHRHREKERQSFTILSSPFREAVNPQGFHTVCTKNDRGRCVRHCRRARVTD